MSKKEDAQELSFLDDGACLYEQVRGPGFAIYERATKQVSLVPFAMTRDATGGDAFKIVPLDPAAVEKWAIVLPTEAIEYGDEEKLLEEIKAHLHKYLDISPMMETLACYYILLSWVYDKFHTIPYLRAIGDTGTGKTRYLDVIGRICYKPIMASGAATAAPIFRMLQAWRGTLVLDEADFSKSDTTADIVKILNTGFEANRPVLRCDKDNPNHVEIHQVFGPKVIATRETFYDKALESRCLSEKMKQTRRTDISCVLGKEFEEEQAILRNKLLMFRFKNYDLINAEGRVADFKIEPRLRQAAHAIARLLANKPELETRFIKFMTTYQRELVEERSTSYEGVVVNTIVQFLADGQANITPKEIAEASKGILGEKDALKPAKVGRILKSLGLVTTNQKVDGTMKRILQFKNPDLWTDVVKRYVPEPNLETEETVETVYTDTGGSVCNNNTPPTERQAELPAYTVSSVSTVSKIFEFFQDRPSADTTSDCVVKNLGIPLEEVESALKVMAHAGQIVEKEPGVYVYRYNQKF